jgi:hypothetical protein
MDTLPQTAGGRRRRTRRPEEAVEETALDTSSRPDMRPELRDDDPRAAAKRRAAVILGHLGSMDEGIDEFYFSPDQIPDGWTYEWKRRTIMGQEDPAYQVALARTGWEAVPSRRHPEMMPAGWKGETIERKGMVLMQRPREITERIEELDLRKARNQIKAKEQQLNAAPPGTMEREFSDARTRPSIKKSFEAMPIPKDD